LTKTEISTLSPLLLETNVDYLINCKIILAYGDNETNEFKRQTIAMKQRLAQRIFSNICSEIENRNHFNVILDLACADSWLSQQVFKQMG